MCLQPNKDTTEIVKDGEWPRTVYKILRYLPRRNVLESPFNAYKWGSGVNISNRASMDNRLHDFDFDHGFHVWINKEDAEFNAEPYNGDIVVELITQKEDFIAAGTDNTSDFTSALFVKVELTETEYFRALDLGPKMDIEEDEDEEEEDDDWEDDWEDEEDYDDEDDYDDEEDEDWEEEDEDEEDEDWEDE